MQRFKIEFEFLTKPTIIQSKYNAITFLNNSTSVSDIVYLNNVPINPGDSISIQGNANEIDTTVYTVSMGQSTTATCIVIKKQNLL